MSPEQKLWLAVIGNACKDLVNPNACPNKQTRTTVQQQAKSWFLSEKLFIGSFEYCCLFTNINPEWLRKIIINGDQETKKRIAQGLIGYAS